MSLNFLSIPHEAPKEELFEPIVESNSLRIERIYSTGQVTPPGTWYDQTQDEWVLVLQGSATISLADGTLHNLSAGDHLHLPARTRHRVERTSSEPPCIWVAVHWGAV